MNRRRLLGLTSAATLLAGLAMAWIPFAGYLGTNDVVVDRDTARIPLTAIPADEFLVVDGQDRRWFVSRDREPIVFALPFDDGAYLLPDLTGDRPHFRCAVFGPIAGQFRCLDPETPSWVRERARWTLAGEPLDPAYSPLPSAPHRVDGDVLVIGDDGERGC